MRRGEFPSAGETTPAELLAAYQTRLAAVVDAVGLERAAARTGVAGPRLEALLEGEAGDLPLESAAAILALEEGAPDAATIEAEARDVLLMGMTTAVVDVDRLASDIDDELEPKEIQQKVEGRLSMTLAEYARLHHELAAQGF